MRSWSSTPSASTTSQKPDSLRAARSSEDMGNIVTDKELIAAASKARGRAHRAPFAEWSKDHRGHSAIVHHTAAWAVRSHELAQIADELRRRGLKLPPCDCPPEDHADD